jgi:hypothetical protein
MKLNDTSRLLIARSERLDRESGGARLWSRADVSDSATKTSEGLEFVGGLRGEIRGRWPFPAGLEVRSYI